MKNLIKNISRTLAMAAVAGVLFSQVMVGEAMAASCVGAGNSCCGAYNYQQAACTSTAGCVWGVYGTNSCTAVPEMSDYLAMTLLAVSVGTVFYIRRRTLAKA